MTEWISVKERLPELGTPIWALFCTRNGEPRKDLPVREGVFDRSSYNSDYIGFFFGIHRNIAMSADYCPKAGLTHWQPRYDNTPPSPHLSSTTDQRAAARIPIRMNLSDEERERRSQRMRDYWATKRADAAAVTTDEQ
jgi:hypothetical protein